MILLCFRGLRAQTQADLDKEACGQFHQADASMNQAYSRILKEYATDEPFLAKLKAAQRAWLAFRDADLEAHFPKADKQPEYGTVYPVCRCTHLQELTEERTKQLKLWLDVTPEGDVCAGSVKTAASVHSSPTSVRGSARCFDSSRRGLQ